MNQSFFLCCWKFQLEIFSNWNGRNIISDSNVSAITKPVTVIYAVNQLCFACSNAEILEFFYTHSMSAANKRLNRTYSYGDFKLTFLRSFSIHTSFVCMRYISPSFSQKKTNMEKKLWLFDRFIFHSILNILSCLNGHRKQNIFCILLWMVAGVFESAGIREGSKSLVVHLQFNSMDES